MKNIPIRSTYNKNNALKFKHIFDRAIQTHNDLLIDVVGSAVSFRIRASDALKWLIENLDGESISDGIVHKEGSYARLRGEIKFSLTIDYRLHLRFLTNKLTVNIRELDTITSREVIWKDQIISFMETAQSGNKLEIKAINLTPEDITWANNMLKQAGDKVISVVEPNYILAKMI